MKTHSTLLRAFLFLFFAAAIASCKEDKDAVAPKSTGLVGRWDLYQTSGGFAGTTTDIATGTSQLEFTADSTVRLYDKGKLVDTRQYSVRNTPDPATGATTQQIFYISLGVRYSPQYIKVDADQLTLTDNMADGFVHRYRRLQQ